MEFVISFLTILVVSIIVYCIYSGEGKQFAQLVKLIMRRFTKIKLQNIRDSIKERFRWRRKNKRN